MILTIVAIQYWMVCLHPNIPFQNTSDSLPGFLAWAVHGNGMALGRRAVGRMHGQPESNTPAEDSKTNRRVYRFDRSPFPRYITGIFCKTLH